MIILTDTRNGAEQLIGALAGDAYQDRPGPRPAGPRFLEAWCPVSPSALEESERRLWGAVAAGDSLLRARIEVAPELAGWDYLVVVDDAPGSQYDALRRLDPADLPGSAACLALAGRGFHGHHGRVWQTVRGNLHLSTICDPDLDAARCGLAMTTLPAVAVLDALDTTGPWTREPGIKWVNDLLIEDRKVAGVLTSTQSFRGRLSGMTLGIGLNVAATPAVPASRCVAGAGCVNELFAGPVGQTPTAGALLREVLQALSARLDTVRSRGPAELIDHYRVRNLVIGRQVAIWPDQAQNLPGAADAHEPVALGVVRSIGPDLSLTLDGHFEPIRCGRLALLD